MTHRDIYINKLNGYELTPPSLVNHLLLEYCYKKHKDLIKDCDEAEKKLEHQRWTECLWNYQNQKRITTPKYIYHVDFDLFMGREYDNLLNEIIAKAQQEYRNIVTSIHLDAFQTEAYYQKWCQRLDNFLLNNERKQVFDYLNIYIDANIVELADLWLDAPVYSSYSNVFDVVKLCSSLAKLTKVNVLYIKKTSTKTGKPIYDNILNPRTGLGWPLNLYNKHSELRDKMTLVMMNDGKTAYIKNIHMSDEEKECLVDYIEKYWKNRRFNAIEFDSRMVMLNGAVKVGDTRHRVELTQNKVIKKSEITFYFIIFCLVIFFLAILSEPLVYGVTILS